MNQNQSRSKKPNEKLAVAVEDVLLLAEAYAKALLALRQAFKEQTDGNRHQSV